MKLLKRVFNFLLPHYVLRYYFLHFVYDLHFVYLILIPESYLLVYRLQFTNYQFDAFAIDGAVRNNLVIYPIGVNKKLTYYDKNSKQYTYLISADNKKKTRIQLQL